MTDSFQYGEPTSILPATPIIAVPRLLPSDRRLFLKYEGANPLSHTFKDRGAVAAVAAAQACGARGILAGTCSNMGTAVAAACARVGLPCWVLTSAKAPRATRNAIAAFATRQWIIEGGFDDVDAAVTALAAAMPEIACINSSLNQAFRDGFKAIMPELIMQMPPDRAYCLVVPTADGTLLGALGEALGEARALVERRGQRWRLVMAQPEGCMPLVKAWRDGEAIRAWSEGNSDVIALSVAAPMRHGPAALAALAASAGFAISVPEADINGWARRASAATGILFDMVGGVLVGALAAADVLIPEGEDLIGLFTGNGLTTAAEQEWAEPIRELKDLEKILSQGVVDSQLDS